MSLAKKIDDFIIEKTSNMGSYVSKLNGQSHEQLVKNGFLTTACLSLAALGLSEGYVGLLSAPTFLIGISRFRNPRIMSSIDEENTMINEDKQKNVNRYGRLFGLGLSVLMVSNYFIFAHFGEDYGISDDGARTVAWLSLSSAYLSHSLSDYLSFAKFDNKLKKD